MKELEKKVVLKIEGLTKVYGVGDIEVRAVDNIDLEASSGEIILIMGPSGSGKTTLVTMAGALLKPTGGKIFIDGEEIVGASEKQRINLRRHKIGFVFQAFNLLSNLTAFENVLVPLGLAGVPRAIGSKKAQGLLNYFDLSQRADFIPEKLSGGEKQRVSIARALANDPKLILADEPTANLDSRRGKDVMRLLRSVAKNMGKTVVIVSHDQRLIDIADKVLWMEDGRIKNSETLATDPNCGNQVEMKEHSHKIDYRGKRYYFCSEGCKREFAEKNSIPKSYF
ncbi:MAG TPA: ATP-binding cassette domain-containing protein [Candidatus Saccharimonadales bacterium]|nr:ATP-binding cassette domain-containing protein [Candidatus Saccharimonadales bacterium]